MKKIILLTLTIPWITLSVIAQNKKVELNIQGMTCENCANKIHTALAKKDGIIKNKVNYPGNWAVIEYDTSKVSIDEIMLTIKKTGFSASPIYPKKEAMSDCKVTCPKPCCTYPNLETGKCSCAAKGKNCTVQCCAYKPDKE